MGVARKAQPALTQKLGNQDKSLSIHYKVYIKQGNTFVVAALGEGASKDVTSNWESPFEGDHAGSQAQKTAGILQSETGNTTITLQGSTQVWSGNQPYTFNLPLIFYSVNNDPFMEVDEALRTLELMNAPEVSIGILGQAKNAYHAAADYLRTGKDFELNLESPVGRIPQPVSITIGRYEMYKDCIIEAMSVPLDGAKTKNGHKVQAEVNLTVQTRRMLNRSEVASSHKNLPLTNDNNI